jgi:small-conductance mechanosensitive channel
MEPDETLAGESKDDDCDPCNMTFKQRVIGGCICSGVGIVFGFLSFVGFLVGNTKLFAVLYTISTVMAVGASFFFAGPKKHRDRLKCPAHVVSLVVLIVGIVGVFAAVLAIGGSLGTALAVVSLIVEIVALIFFYITLYAIAWTAVKAFFKRICKCEC